MKSRIPFIVPILLIFLSGCTLPDYVPKVKEMVYSPYGAQIDLKTINKAKIKGELIAVEGENLVILQDGTETPTIEKVNLNDLATFDLRFADASDAYPYFIPLSFLVSVSHGALSIASYPVNTLVTLVIAINSHRDYLHTERTISKSHLHMFARFPQGIPPGVSLSEIR